jgi:hypothetical protein
MCSQSGTHDHVFCWTIGAAIPLFNAMAKTSPLLAEISTQALHQLPRLHALLCHALPPSEGLELLIRLRPCCSTQLYEKRL